MRNINSGKNETALFAAVLHSRNRGQDICNNFTEDEMRRRDKVYISHFLYIFTRGL